MGSKRDHKNLLIVRAFSSSLENVQFAEEICFSRVRKIQYQWFSCDRMWVIVATRGFTGLQSDLCFTVTGAKNHKIDPIDKDLEFCGQIFIF